MKRFVIPMAMVAVVFAMTAGCGAKGSAGDGKVAIQVTEDGFVPAEVTVAAGRPVTLVVTRTTDKTCATEMVMPAMHINRALPLGEAVEVQFTPEHAETLEYACGMDMVKGRVIVK